jgi:hypothetical protein
MVRGDFFNAAGVRRSIAEKLKGSWPSQAHGQPGGMVSRPQNSSTTARPQAVVLSPLIYPLEIPKLPFKTVRVTNHQESP